MESKSQDIRIALAMIVKDDSELSSLRETIASVEEAVDGVYITTNHAPDDEIRAYCQEKEFHHSFREWDDSFASARNFNFSQIPEGQYDYILWLDADDLFVGTEKLREYAAKAKNTGKDAVLLTYWYGCTFKHGAALTPENIISVDLSHPKERLLRPGVFTWNKRLHEVPVAPAGAKSTYSRLEYDPKEMPLLVVHTSTEEQVASKMERNRRILELELEDERATPEGADPRTLLYLMKILSMSEKPADWMRLKKYGAEYLERSGWDEERATAHSLLAIVEGKMGYHNKVISHLHSAIEEWPYNPYYYVQLAAAYFNVRNYRACKHWLDFAATLDLDFKGSTPIDFHSIKLTFAETLCLYHQVATRDFEKALEAAKLVFIEKPTLENNAKVEYLEDLVALNAACKNSDQLAEYLESIGEEKAVFDLFERLPQAIASQPFAVKWVQKVSPPRVWGEKEICYLASFGGKHFEEWSAKSLDKGIGGSETAVIALAREWTKLGYKVTVYGDPGADKGEHDGVQYRPWYEFNKDDKFNILIQWRSWFLADKVDAKFFGVDLHDLYSPVDLTKETLDHIDKIFVKSQFHRNLAPKVPDSKFAVISNGVFV